MTDLPERLGELTLDAGYTVDGVRERLGEVAAAALAREETIPALRATREGDTLGTLIRLWWLGCRWRRRNGSRWTGSSPRSARRTG